MARIGIPSLFIAAFAGFLAWPNVQAQYWSSCLTPVKEQGSCVLVTECNFIRLVLQKPILEANDIRYVEASRCGTHQKKALVCCAKPSGTPPATTSSATNPVTSRIDTQTQPQADPSKKNLLPKPPACGIQYSDRIIGGERTSIDSYPWTARVQHFDERSNSHAFHCGGSLINELYVLTAAHCISSIPKTWTVNAIRLGEWDTETDPDCLDDGSDCYDRVQDIDVKKAIVHENYANSKTEVQNDIALLRLARKANYSDTVVPICLPLDSSFASRPYETLRLFVAGWGQTETERGSRYKLFVAVNGVSQSSCREKYASANIDSRHICAGGEAGKDSCRGDSGGPLMDVLPINEQPVYYLAGVVSYGKQCGLRGVPGVYTKVHTFSNWILNNIEP